MPSGMGACWISVITPNFNMGAGNVVEDLGIIVKVNADVVNIKVQSVFSMRELGGEIVRE